MEAGKSPATKAGSEKYHTGPRGVQHEDKLHASKLDCIMPEAISTILDVDDWEVFQESLHGVHTLGSVPLIEGRRLCWPNTLRSKDDPFGLLNPRQSGYLTVIKLRLVDPHEKPPRNVRVTGVSFCSFLQQTWCQ